MRPTLDPAEEELTAVLERLLQQGIEITARAVAREHSTIKNASSFTRNKARMGIISKYQRQQKAPTLSNEDGVEDASERAHSSGRPTAEASATVEENRRLKRQVDVLIIATAACINAVRRAGGTRALLSFWADYSSIADEVRKMGAMPLGADIVPIQSGEKSS